MNSISNPAASLFFSLLLGSPVAALDCNQNGVPDDLDITAGTSIDCNGNGIPDECEVATWIREDFENPVSNNYVLHGAAQVTQGALQLTTPAPGTNGHAAFVSPFPTANTRWEVSFDFEIELGTADQIGCALYDAATYDPNLNPPGASPWLILDFDHWYNPPGSDGGHDPNSNHVELVYRDSGGDQYWLYSPSFGLENAAWNHVRLVCDGGLLTVWLEAPGSLPEVAFSQIAFPGQTPTQSALDFYAGGGQFNAYHRIDNVLVSFPVLVDTDCNADGILDECEIASNPGLDLDQNGVLDSCECTAANYCQASVNSAGTSAGIGWQGELSLSANNFSLGVSGAPPLKFGIFFYGANQTQMPLGEGQLCVALDVQRIQPLVVTDQQGTALMPIDLTSAAFSSGPFAVTPLSTWNFQFWYRDRAGGPAGFNFSDGLEVTFCP